MTEGYDRSVEAQMRRNSQSNTRFALGCQIAHPVLALWSLLPLGLSYMFTDNLVTLLIVLALSNLLLAFAAVAYRRRSQEKTLGHSIAGWLAVMASLFAGMCALVAASHALSL